jgi:hypothetical protein
VKPTSRIVQFLPSDQVSPSVRNSPALPVVLSLEKCVSDDGRRGQDLTGAVQHKNSRAGNRSVSPTRGGDILQLGQHISELAVAEEIIAVDLRQIHDDDPMMLDRRLSRE